jgi:hypothetical protein
MNLLVTLSLKLYKNSRKKLIIIGGIDLKIVSLVISATALLISAGALALSIIALIMKVEK